MPERFICTMGLACIACLFLPVNCFPQTSSETSSVAATATISSTPDDAPLLPLSQALQLALMNNRPVRIALLDITKAHWQVAAAKTARYPIVQTDIFGSGNLTPAAFTFAEGIFGTVNGKPVPSQNESIPLSQGFTGFITAQVAQPLSQLYKVGLAIHEQQLQAELAGEKYRGQRQSVSASVKQAYYGVLQTESALDAQRALVKEYQETDRVAEQYLAQQATLKSNSLEVKAKLAQAQYQIVQLDDTLLTQKEQLNTLLGRDLDTPFRAEQVPAITAEETDLKAARSTALNQRPEVKQSEINVQRADIDRKLAKAEYIPDIAASLHYLNPIDTTILPQNILSAGVEMKWDPFDWGKRRDDIKQKETVVDQTRTQLDETRAQILLDVDNCFRKLAESRALLAVAEAGRAAATEKLREVNEQFKKSAVLFRDVLDQEAAVANANHSYEESLLGFWNAKANFEKALGEE
jgi:outer membrane protein TolC